MAQSLNYLNKDFTELNDTLIQYIKDRFPNDYTDISKSNPGQIFTELAAYVGTINSFYLDNQFQNLLPQYTTDVKALLSYAYIQGYAVRPTTSAVAEITIVQLVPAKLVLGKYEPDYNYALIIPANTSVFSNSNTSATFLTESVVDFKYSTPDDVTEIEIHSYDDSDNPEFYKLTKKVKAVSGVKKTIEFTFTNPTKYSTVQINDTDILYIQNVTDSDGNVWHEVPYLGQNTLFNSTPNTNVDKNLVKYVIGIEKIDKRFVSRFKSSNLLEIEFGAGIYNSKDIQLVPTLDSIKKSKNKYNNTYDPINPNSFLYTKEYGEAPANTTLTFTYITGGGTKSNVPSNTITNINTNNITFNGIVDGDISTFVLQNISVTNEISSDGGRNSFSMKELRNILIANHAAQDRAVNLKDYTVRCLSLPTNYGVVAKSFTRLDTTNNKVVNISALSLDSSGNFSTLSPTLKNNLHTYISEYAFEGTSINVTSAYIINIGIEFEITVYNNQSPKDVLLRTFSTIKEYFSKENWQINQPIIISDIIYKLSIVDGVQSVVSVNLKNISGGKYSDISYDITSATRNNVIYPSIDPSIFEIKFPDIDISGRVKTI